MTSFNTRKGGKLINYRKRPPTFVAKYLDIRHTENALYNKISNQMSFILKKDKNTFPANHFQCRSVQICFGDSVHMLLEYKRWRDV